MIKKKSRSPLEEDQRTTKQIYFDQRKDRLNKVDTRFNFNLNIIMTYKILCFIHINIIILYVAHIIILQYHLHQHRLHVHCWFDYAMKSHITSDLKHRWETINLQPLNPWPLHTKRNPNRFKFETQYNSQSMMNHKNFRNLGLRVIWQNYQICTGSYYFPFICGNFCSSETRCLMCKKRLKWKRLSTMRSKQQNHKMSSRTTNC